MQYSTRARTRSTTENRAKLSIYDLNLIYNRKSQQQQNHLRTAIIKPNRTHPKYAQRTLRLATCVCVPSGMQWNRWKNMHSFFFFIVKSQFGFSKPGCRCHCCVVAIADVVIVLVTCCHGASRLWFAVWWPHTNSWCGYMSHTMRTVMTVCAHTHTT